MSDIFIDAEGHVIKNSMVDEHSIIKITEKVPDAKNIGKIICGETNSNILTFEMNRFYDNVDMISKNIKFIIKTPSFSFDDYASNVQHNANLIRFSWVVPYAATQEAGNVNVAIEFFDDSYSLKTMPFVIKVDKSINSEETQLEVPTNWYISIESRILQLENKTNENIADVVEDYMNEHPVQAVSDEHITEIVDDYMSKNSSTFVTDEHITEVAVASFGSDEFNTAVDTQVNAYLAENDLSKNVNNFLFATEDFLIEKEESISKDCFTNAFYEQNKEVGETCVFTPSTHPQTLCAQIAFNETTVFVFNKALSVYGNLKYCYFVDTNNVIQKKVSVADIVAGTEIECDFDGTAYLNIYPVSACDIIKKVKKYVSPVSSIEELKGSVTNNAIINEYMDVSKKECVAECGYDRTEGSYYINSNGTISKFSTATTGAYSFSEPIKVSCGDIINCTLQGYLTNIALISKCNETLTLTDKVIPLVISESSNKVNISYKVNFNGYICLCGANADFTYNIIHSDLMMLLGDNIQKCEDSISSVNYIDMYNKVLFIGDSVTDGGIIDNTNAISAVVRKLSYPTRLQQLVPHLEIVNNAHAGESIQGWNNNRFETEYANVCEGVDLCIIELGWNQTGDYAFPSTTDEVDSIMESDVLAFDNYANYITEKSPIGNYCQLVEKVKNATPNATIVLVCSCGWGVNSVRKYAIEKIAEWANVLCIDTTAYDFNDGGDSVHSTPYGYTKKAMCILKELNNVFSKNKDYINLKMYALNNLLS